MNHLDNLENLDNLEKKETQPKPQAASMASFFMGEVDDNVVDGRVIGTGGNKTSLDAPFRYGMNQNEDIILNSGNLQLTYTDFVLPGKNGFDLAVSRTYDSGNANTEELNPLYESQDLYTYRITGAQSLRLRLQDEDRNLVIPSGVHYWFNDDRYTYDETEKLAEKQLDKMQESWTDHYERRDTISPDVYSRSRRSELERYLCQRTDQSWHYLFYEYSIPYGRPQLDPKLKITYQTYKTPVVQSATRPNNHFLNRDGLGYGWRFNFPSIESYSCGTVEVISATSYSFGTEQKYLLHLTDGRTFAIKDIDSSPSLDDYKLSDIGIKKEAGNLAHPHYPASFNYTHVVSYKNGDKDFYQKTGNQVKLCARTDKFGNMILFADPAAGQVMRIVDTWGREFSLNRIDNRLEWNINGNVYTYTIAGSCLSAFTDPMGNQTTYSYDTQYTQPKFAEQKLGDMKNPSVAHILLKTVTHPTGVQTLYTYGNKTENTAIAREYMKYFPVLSRCDMANGSKYNAYSYSYESGGHIRQACVESEDGISTTENFNDKHLRTSREIRHGGKLISQSSYEYGSAKYDDKLPVSETEKRFDSADESRFLTKTTKWTYSSDGKANKIKQTEDYAQYPQYNQETCLTYDSQYSMVTEKSIQLAADTLLIERYSLQGGPVYKQKLVIEANSGIENTREKTTYDYDSRYRIQNERRFFGEALESSYKTSYTYDDNSFTDQPVSVTQHQVREEGGKTADYTIKMDYDWFGRLASKTDANGNTTRYTVDKLGRVKEEHHPDYTGNTINYDDVNNIITQTNENGVTKKSIYTPMGKISAVRITTHGPDTLLASYEYDNMERCIAEFAYNQDGSVRSTTAYTYDSFGRILKKTICGNGVDYLEAHTYTDLVDSKYFCDEMVVAGDTAAPTQICKTYADWLGNVCEEYTGEIRTGIHSYDKTGNRLSATDANGNTTSWTYDYAARVIEEKNALGECMLFTYNALGKKIAETDRRGNTVRFEYDSAGRLNRQESPFDGELCAEIKYRYDPNGNLTKQQTLASRLDNSTYWRTLQYVYDTRGRQTEAIIWENQSGSKYNLTRYVYDDAGNKTQVHTGITTTDSAGAVVQHTYDRFGNMLTMLDARSAALDASHPDYRIEKYEYDSTGQLISKTDRNGNSTSYETDALGRVVRQYAQANTPDGYITNLLTVLYSRSGQKVRESVQETGSRFPAVQTTSYAYDNLGRLIEVNEEGHCVKRYTYDSAGNKSSFTLTQAGASSAEISLYYQYDPLNRLTALKKDNANGILIADYAYDSNGNRVLQRFPQSGIASEYSYNHANLVTSLTNSRAGSIISQWTYRYSTDGNQLSKTDKIGQTTQYEYDYSGRMRKEFAQNWHTITYEYNRFQNRSQMVKIDDVTGAKITTKYSYHDNNWLLTEVESDNVRSATKEYFYDHNGNLCRWEKSILKPKQSDVRGKLCFAPDGEEALLELRNYNAFGQLVWVYRDGEETHYSYRADGLRHHKITPNGEIIHHWDGQNIVMETLGHTVRARYLRGGSLVAQEIDNLRWYYLHNAHGDVVQRIQENGTAAPEYDYDSFGNTLTPAQNDPNPFRYCGEYFDAETTSYYLRNRNYEPGTGRFTQEDMARDGFNWYTYCENDPIANIDPTGLYAVVVISGITLLKVVYETLVALGMLYLVYEQGIHVATDIANDYRASQKAQENSKPMHGGGGRGWSSNAIHNETMFSKSQNKKDTSKKESSDDKGKSSTSDDPEADAGYEYGGSTTKDLDVVGDENTYQEKRDETGKLMRRRYYGDDGRAVKDTDYSHNGEGSHEFPHDHYWDWSNPTHPVRY